MKQNYLMFLSLYFVINMLIFGAKSMWEWFCFPSTAKSGNTYDKDSACFYRVSCGCDCSRYFWVWFSLPILYLLCLWQVPLLVTVLYQN